MSDGDMDGITSPLNSRNLSSDPLNSSFLFISVMNVVMKIEVGRVNSGQGPRALRCAKKLHYADSRSFVFVRFLCCRVLFSCFWLYKRICPCCPGATTPRSFFHQEKVNLESRIMDHCHAARSIQADFADLLGPLGAPWGLLEAILTRAASRWSNSLSSFCAPAEPPIHLHPSFCLSTPNRRFPTRGPGARWVGIDSEEEGM